MMTHFKVSCLLGLLSFGILFCNLISYKELLSYNFIIGFLYVVSELYNYTHSIDAYECALLIVILLYQIAHKYHEEFYTKMNFLLIEDDHEIESKENDYALNDDSSSNLGMNACIEELIILLPEIKKKSKKILEKIISSLQVLAKGIIFQSNSLFLENLGTQLDEEDRLYIQQSCLPAQISQVEKQKRFTTRGSVDKIIEKGLNPDAIFILKQVSSN